MSKRDVVIDTGDLRASVLEAEAMAREIKGVEAAQEKAKRGRPSKSKEPPSPVVPRKNDVPPQSTISPDQQAFIDNGFKIPQEKAAPARAAANAKKEAAGITPHEVKQMYADIERIKGYHKFFPHIFGHEPNKADIDPAKVTPVMVAKKVQSYRSAMNGQFGYQLSHGTLLAGASVFEIAYTGWLNHHPLNPVRGRYNLMGLSSQFDTPEAKELFDPLLAEWRIEYPWLFEQPLWVRTLHAFLLVCKKTSEDNAHLPSSTAAPVGGFDDI